MSFKPIVTLYQEMKLGFAMMQLNQHFTGLRMQQLFELVDQTMAEATVVELRVVLGLQLITIIMEYYLLKEQLLSDLGLLIRLKYARCLNYIGPQADLVFNLTGFAFGFFSFDLLITIQSSETIRLVEHPKLMSGYPG